MMANKDESACTNSLGTVPTDFQKSLHEAGIDNVLAMLSKKSDFELRLRLNEQRGDPDLDVERKLSILRNKLESSPGSFLFQFGRYLSKSHLDCFSSIRSKHYEVDFYLSEMERSSPGTRTLQIKNRRYEALQKLVDTTDYFTEEEMQRRNPILFNQLIGRYHSKEEREAFLFQSSKSSSSTNIDPSCRPTPLTDMLIAHMSRGDGICSDRRIDQEMQLQEEKQADQYSNKKSISCSPHRKDSDLSDEDSEEDDQDRMDDDEQVPEIDEAEKDLLKEEFFTTMYRHFLEGKDKDFPYDTVDCNTDYDIGETLDQDEEEKYFDRDDDQDCEETEGQEAEGQENRQLTTGNDYMVQDGEEDELDSYMRVIEAEIQEQNRYAS